LLYLVGQPGFFLQQVYNISTWLLRKHATAEMSGNLRKTGIEPEKLKIELGSGWNSAGNHFRFPDTKEGSFFHMIRQ
ncbi:MAG: hypothetical protein DRN21_03690, partial [Thermoplasmata archaeon]